MGSFRSSADPFFWMHHCMVDRIWYRWQYKSGAANLNLYDANPMAEISGQWEIPVEEMFDSKALGVCYQDPMIVAPGKWEFLQRLNVTMIKSISRVVPGFFPGRRMLSEETNQCSCAIKLPPDLVAFWMHQKLSISDVEKSLCYLYHGGKVEKKRLPGYRLWDDDLVWQLGKEFDYKINTIQRKPPVINPPFPCYRYNKRKLTCKRLKACYYDVKKRRCIVRN